MSSDHFDLPAEGMGDSEDDEKTSFGIIRIGPEVPNEFIFRFQLGPALLDQLRAKLQSLTPVALSPNLDAGYPGFYQLLLDGKPVYIGKTSRTIGERLAEHYKKLSKAGVPLKSVTARWAFVEDLSQVDIAEQALAKYFKMRGESQWSGTGIGSKVSGFRRGKQSSKFSDLYKPDLERPIQAGSNKKVKLRALIRQIDDTAPVHFKIPREFAREFDASFSQLILIEPETLPFRQWVERIEERLGKDWHVVREPLSWFVVKK